MSVLAELQFQRPVRAGQYKQWKLSVLAELQLQSPVRAGQVLYQPFTKCMCAKITSKTAADAKCAFTGPTPDDDNVKVNCGDLRTAKIDGISLSTPGDENDSSKTSSITTNDDSIYF